MAIDSVMPPDAHQCAASQAGKYSLRKTRLGMVWQNRTVALWNHFHARIGPTQSREQPVHGPAAYLDTAGL